MSSFSSPLSRIGEVPRNNRTVADLGGRVLSKPVCRKQHTPAAGRQPGCAQVLPTNRILTVRPGLPAGRPAESPSSARTAALAGGQNLFLNRQRLDADRRASSQCCCGLVRCALRMGAPVTDLSTVGCDKERRASRRVDGWTQQRLREHVYRYKSRPRNSSRQAKVSRNPYNRPTSPLNGHADVLSRTPRGLPTSHKPAARRHLDRISLPLWVSRRR
jgi:hypothetical protein